MIIEPQTHEDYMHQAIEMARMALAEDEVPAGCVIVTVTTLADFPPGAVIARAYNQVEMLKDPTAHAEMIAITQATEAVGDWRLTDTVLYVTKEPCVMCAGAIVLARIPLVVYGAPDDRRGAAGSAFDILDSARLNHRAKVIGGVLRDECAGLLSGFFREKREDD